MIGLDTAAPAKTKVASATLLLISGFTIRVMKSSLLTDGLTIKRVAELLVQEPAEDRRRGLFIEVQLRDRLIADDLDFCLLIIGRNDARIREKLRVGILVQSRIVTDICGTPKGWQTVCEGRGTKTAEEVFVIGVPEARNRSWE